MSTDRETEACAACGRALDPLRAGQVAIVDGAFRYFCDSKCKGAFFQGTVDEPTAAPPSVSVESRSPPPVEAAPKQAPPKTSVPPNSPRASDAPPKVAPLVKPLAVDAVRELPTPTLPASPSVHEASPPRVAVVAEPDAPASTVQASPLALPTPRLKSSDFAPRASKARSREARSVPFSILAIGTLLGFSGWAVDLLALPRVTMTLAALAVAFSLALEVRLRTYRISRSRPLVILANAIFAVADFITAQGAHLGFAALVAGTTTLGLLAIELRKNTFDSNRKTAPFDFDFLRDPTSRSHRELMLVCEWGSLIALVFAAIVSLSGGMKAPMIALVSLGAAAALSLDTVHALLAITLAEKLADAGSMARQVSSRGLRELAEQEQLLLELRGVVIDHEPRLVEVVVERERDVASLLAANDHVLSHPYARALVDWATEQRTDPTPRTAFIDRGGYGITTEKIDGRLTLGTKAFFVERGIGVAKFDETLRLRDDEALSVWFVSLDDRAVGYALFREHVRLDARAAIRSLLEAHVEPVLVAEESAEFVERLAKLTGVAVHRGDLMKETRVDFLREILGVESRTALIAGEGAHSLFEGVALPLVVHVRNPSAVASESPKDALSIESLADIANVLTVVRRMSSEFRRAFILLVMPASIFALGIGFGLVPPIFGPFISAATALVAVFWSSTLSAQPELRPSR